MTAFFFTTSSKAGVLTCLTRLDDILSMSYTLCKDVRVSLYLILHITSRADDRTKVNNIVHCAFIPSSLTPPLPPPFLPHSSLTSPFLPHSSLTSPLPPSLLSYLPPSSLTPPLPPPFLPHSSLTSPLPPSLLPYLPLPPSLLPYLPPSSLTPLLPPPFLPHSSLTSPLPPFFPVATKLSETS